MDTIPTQLPILDNPSFTGSGDGHVPERSYGSGYYLERRQRE